MHGMANYPDKNSLKEYSFSGLHAKVSCRVARAELKDLKEKLPPENGWWGRVILLVIGLLLLNALYRIMSSLPGEIPGGYFSMLGIVIGILLFSLWLSCQGKKQRYRLLLFAKQNGMSYTPERIFRVGDGGPSSTNLSAGGNVFTHGLHKKGDFGLQNVRSSGRGRSYRFTFIKIPSSEVFDNIVYVSKKYRYLKMFLPISRLWTVIAKKYEQLSPELASTYVGYCEEDRVLARPAQLPPSLVTIMLKYANRYYFQTSGSHVYAIRRAKMPLYKEKNLRELLALAEEMRKALSN